MKELTMSAEVKNIPVVIEFVNRELDKIGCPEKAKSKIDIAIDELYSNIANYAFDDQIGVVTVTVDSGEEPYVVTLSFRYNGKPFNPLLSEDPDVTLSAKDRMIGGLGIFLVKKSMDDIQYEYKDGKNILTLKKKL